MASSSSTALSSVAVSLCPGVTTGVSFPTSSPSSGEENIASRAVIQLMLPRRVLISPLCITKRYGCASFQEPRVFVLNREWIRANEVTSEGSTRSW